MSWKFRVPVSHSGLLLLSALLISVSTTAANNATTWKPPVLRITKPTVPTTTSTIAASALTPAGTVATTAATTLLSPLKSSPAAPTASSTTAAATPDICLHGIKAFSAAPDEEDDSQQHGVGGAGVAAVQYERDFVYVIEGDIMLSVLTTDPESALFVVNRINHANLIEADFDVGMRAIHVQNAGQTENLLLQEIEYQQQCVQHAIGIFIDHDLYQQLEAVIKELEYNVWPIPSPRAYIFPKVAHLLHQLPWGEHIASVEILTENLAVYNEFMESVRRERMCLMHFKSEENIYILFGNKMAHHFDENGTIFAVPTERTDRAFIADLPDKAYIMMESELDMALVDQNSTQVTLSEVLVGKSVLPSRVLALARPLLELIRWLRAMLLKNCRQMEDTISLEHCENFLTFVEDWRSPEYKRDHSVAELLELLRMRKFGTLMNFQMYQKKRKTVDTAASAEDTTELREIAAQNFVTNITTNYHYNKENQTSLELKTKFGQVFNCQYSAGDNNRYPFLFDGESVMFWRLKPDAWVATGMTAAILGLIITLAVLVFIVVRISLGDVFEGNPVTSILLLLSLVMLFISFVPFALEYVGAQPNSHVTFDDAATLNTLCAVRVFVLTLVYCFAFSLLLCRAVMLASIGAEGGFLSHVNGYMQAVICVFSILVQLCMSVQLLVVMQVASQSVSCESMYYGRWLWGLVAYDFMLLACIVGLVPFIYRSQRNYREGILIVIGAVLIFIIWLVWIIMSLFGDEMRDAAIPLGLQATGWAILVGVLVPRTFLIVRGIERSDIAQALPSLSSLAFAQNNQFTSEQSVYECVNPAMRHCAPDEVHQSPSEIPTLPLRGGGPRRQQFFANLRQANANINPQRPPPRPQRAGSPTGSVQSSLPPSPDNSKITRF